MYLALDDAAQKKFMDKYPTTALCTKPNKPDQALEFAIAFEEVVKRQKAYGTQVPETAKAVVESEPIYAIDKINPRECYRCGEANFTMEHLNFCIANKFRCKF